MDLTLPVAVGILAAGLLVGLFSALFGVGGGVVMVPFMVLVLDLQQQTAEGTSLLVIVPTALAGVAAHRRGGLRSLRAGVLVALGGIAGAFAGARIAVELTADTLQAGFGILLCLTGARLVLGAWRAPRSTTGTSRSA